MHNIHVQCVWALMLLRALIFLFCNCFFVCLLLSLGGSSVLRD
jgi:hypothetical protein